MPGSTLNLIWREGSSVKTALVELSLDRFIRRLNRNDTSGGALAAGKAGIQRSPAAVFTGKRAEINRCRINCQHNLNGCAHLQLYVPCGTVIGLNLHGFLLHALLVARCKGNLDFSFPARGNLTGRSQRGCAASASLDFFYQQRSSTLIFKNKTMRQRGVGLDRAEIMCTAFKDNFWWACGFIYGALVHIPGMDRNRQQPYQHRSQNIHTALLHRHSSHSFILPF